MKILQVISGLQKAAGTSVFCGEIANQCVRQGHECDILVSTEQKNPYPIDSRIHLITKLSCTDYDVVHIHGLWMPWLHKQSNWAHHNNIPIVWSPHGMLAPWAMAHKRWKKTLPWYLYQKKDLQHAQMLHVTSDTEAAWCQDLGLTQAHLYSSVADNISSTPRFSLVGLGVYLEPLLNSFPKSNKKTMLFVSRVQKKKGLLNLVQAWSKIDHKGWTLKIVGPDQEGHSEEVRHLASKLNVLDSIEIIGPLFGHSKDLAYREASCFVLPTFSENFGSVIIEALAFACPVITTKGTPWEELEQEHCGWWIDIGVQPLIDALKTAMSLSAQERHEMGLRGRALVERKYTWSAIGEQMIKAYNELVDNKGLPK